MTKQINSLAPLKERVREYLQQKMPNSTRELLLENLLDQAYLSGVVDTCDTEVDRLKQQQQEIKQVHA